MAGIWWLLEVSSEAKGLCVITALLSCALLLSFISLLKPSPKLPPGPLALPLIGHLHLLGSHPPRSLARMSHRYGPLLSLKLGSIHFIVASTPEAARQILQIHDQTFAYRAHLAAVDAIYGRYLAITFSEPSSYWRFLRQLGATELFSIRCLERFKPIRFDEVRALLRSIYADGAINSSATESSIPNQEAKCTSQASRLVSNGLIQLRPRLQKTTNSIISRMAVGETSHMVLHPVLEAVEALSTVNIGDFLPWIQWADVQGCVKQSKKAGLRMHAAFQQMIEQRRQQRGGTYEPPADILDILLSAALTCPKDLEITDAHIRTVLLDIFGGGSDTSGVVLEWAMAELLANPMKMKKVEEEIESVVSRKQVNKNTVEEADTENMPYLQAAVKETMRLHPVLPLLVPRESRKACQIFGFDIPAKTQAFINVWAIGRDPKIWDNPNEFEPQRFLDRNIDGHGQHFEFLPFGSGRRVCPGKNLGMLNIHIILASLLHAFSWTSHDPGHDMSEKIGFITTKANPLVARATPKLPSHFYD